jgi:TonB-linked SusC/RagA family outer membrane protein
MCLDKEKGKVLEHVSFVKPMCAAAILCSCLFAIPLQSFAAGSQSPAAAAADLITIKGVVIDPMGDPIIGANIVQVGNAGNGTITDFDGNFLIKVPAASFVDVSYIGYETQRVKVTPGKNMRIILTVDTKTLEDVVVIGYGTAKKRDLTGAVAQVKSDEIVLTPTSNPMQALQGKVAGLDITRTSGQAGAGVNIQLRGNRSITASGEPLFIIDGMPGNINTINLNDIESIDILKDASSTAIYGAQGANGVVLVTTKHGSEGKLSVNLNAYVGFNGWSQNPELRSGETYMETIRQANRNAGTYNGDESMLISNGGRLSDAVYSAYKAGQNIDWIDEILNDGYIQNYSLSLTGGTERTKAYMSLNFSDEKGQYKNDKNSIYSTNIRIDHSLNKYISAGINLQGSYVWKSTPYAKQNDAIVAVPFGTLYNEDGTINPYPLGSGETGYISLLLNDDKSVYRKQREDTDFSINPYFKITPIKGLTWESRLNCRLFYRTYNSFEGLYSNKYYTQNQDVSRGTSVSITRSHSYNYQWENILTYNFTLNEAHEFTVTGVTSWTRKQGTEDIINGSGVKNNKLLWYTISTNCTTTTVDKDAYEQRQSLGFVGRINYQYKGKYLASASVRRDGNSVLADGHKWDTYPAVSLGWRISDEDFMESTRDVMNNLKIRAGYGEAGMANIDPYSSITGVEQGMITIGGQLIQPTYSATKTIANKLLGWERSKTWNIGFDASFLNDRINVVADYYITNSDDVIWKIDIPVTNGAYSYNSPYNTNMNMAKTSNKGIEFAVNTRNIDTPNLKWNSSLTFAYNKEEVTKLLGTGAAFVKSADQQYMHIVGEPVWSFRHFKLDGVWSESEAEDAAVFNQEPGHLKISVPGLKHVGPGVYTKVVNGETITYDATNKYALSSNDYQPIGHNSPDWSLGFQNSFIYKNFDLTLYMYMRWGQMIKYETITDYDPTGVNNFPTYLLDKIGTSLPVLDATKTNKLSQYEGFDALKYVDGSFFKIKNITLGYTLPKDLMKKINIQKFRIYGTMTNPLVLAKSDMLKDYDPEMNGSRSYPLTKQLVFGLNVTF